MYEEPVYEFDLSELMSEEWKKNLFKKSQQWISWSLGAEEAPAAEEAGIEDDLLAGLGTPRRN